MEKDPEEGKFRVADNWKVSPIKEKFTSYLPWMLAVVNGLGNSVFLCPKFLTDCFWRSSKLEKKGHLSLSRFWSRDVGSRRYRYSTMYQEGTLLRQEHILSYSPIQMMRIQPYWSSLVERIRNSERWIPRRGLDYLSEYSVSKTRLRGIARREGRKSKVILWCTVRNSSSRNLSDYTPWNLP